MNEIDNEGCNRLSRAIRYLRTGEEISPSADLYCDLAECYLLLKDFTRATGYARHAILESDPPSERACYIATAGYLLENTEQSRQLAKVYANMFPAGEVALEEFKAIRAELGVSEEAKSAAVAGAD